MNNKKPEALRLANELDCFRINDETLLATVSELRRLHEVNAELVEALKEIAEWADRYTTPGHPISKVSRAAIAKATGEQQQ